MTSTIKPHGWLLATTCLAGTLLAGCSSLSGTTMETTRLLIHGQKQHLSLTPAEVAKKPFYQLEVTSKAGAALLILGNVDDGREAWYSAAHEILFLKHGVLVKTYNMDPDILATRLPANSPFVTGLEHLQGPTETTRILDLPPYRYGVAAHSTLTPEGPTTITILGKAHAVLKVREAIAAKAIGFKAVNTYWVDPDTGFVWKSTQTIPGGMTLTFTELKPYHEGQS